MIIIHTKVLKTYININPHIVKSATYKEVENGNNRKKVENFGKNEKEKNDYNNIDNNYNDYNKKFNRPYLMKSLSSENVLATKFFEKNSKVFIEDLKNSRINLNSNLNNEGHRANYSNDNNDNNYNNHNENNNMKNNNNKKNISITEMIEEEKKKELLMKIKAELSFD
jgi:hypothetical protein